MTGGICRHLMVFGSEALHDLLPGEDTDTIDVEDVELWVEVYGELTRACRDLGIVNHRFEQRLAYWQTRRYAPHRIAVEISAATQPAGTGI